jgi:CHASE3 domain sensor protein
MSSGIPSFFKTPRHRSFEYKPMYYDEQKERKEELERLVEENRTGTVSDDARLNRLRSKINQRWGMHSKTNLKQQTYNQKMRLVAILGFLAALVWFFFNWA